jgi:hypothetical protein
MFLSLEASIRTDAPYNPLEPDRVLHLAYTVRKGRAAGVLVDAFGELLEVFAVGGGDRAGLIGKLWVEVLSRVGVRGGFAVRIVVGKVGALEAAEVQGEFEDSRCWSLRVRLTILFAVIRVERNLCSMPRDMGRRRTKPMGRFQDPRRTPPLPILPRRS